MEKITYILDYQYYISTNPHNLLTIKYIDKCDERLAFEGGAAAVQLWSGCCKICLRPGWLISYLNSSGLVPYKWSERFKIFSIEEVSVFPRKKGNKKGINQPPRPGNLHCKIQIINCPGHPSLNCRDGSRPVPTISNLRFYNSTLSLRAMPWRGD